MNVRRLAALMFTDMVGYSALAHKNELLARQLVNEQRSIIREAIKRHHGREHDTAGDGFFIEFSSAVDAAECAVAIQSQIFDRNRSAAPDRQINVRIGLHLGDVVSQDKDLFGDGVNLAARIEPLAESGGICITQQVFDQVNGKIPTLKFKKLGHQKLKNIASGAVVYAVQLPWSKSKEKKAITFSKRMRELPVFENMSSALGASIFTVCLLLLSYSIFSAFTQSSPQITLNSRLPASESRLDLSSGWNYKIGNSSWLPFDAKKSWKYSDLLQGKFYLKNIAKGQIQSPTPAIVLGLLPDRHGVYLNGHFVGGSDSSTELAFYSFDQSLWLTDRDNEIVIEVESRPSLNPGLSVLPNVGAFVGDFHDVRKAVSSNKIQFELLRNLYFSFSVFIFIVAFVYAVFKRSSRAYFYFAFVLLLGTLQLAYFNPLITAAFSYPYLRFLKALGTTLLPIVLISSFLATGEDKKKERRRLEFWNNLVGAVLAGVSAVLLFKFSSTTVRFTENFNAILVLTLVYSTLALTFLVTHLTKLAIKKNLDLQAVAVHGFYGLFLSIGFIGAAAALKRSALSDYVSESVRSSAITLTMATPVLFGLAVMAFAVVEHIRQTHLARDQKSRDDFALEVLHLIHDSSDSVTAAKEIHRRLTTFVGATRSTLFIANSNQGLVPLSQVGTHLVAARGDHGPNQKILTHVLDSNSPLLISDVSKDLRFASPQAPSSYSTGSCMVLPLRTMGQKRGVITFADKKDGNAFSDADFALVLEVSSTLALLINAEGSKVLHLAA